MIERAGEAAERFAVDALRKAVLHGDLVSGQRLVERIPDEGARVRSRPRTQLTSIIAAFLAVARPGPSSSPDLHCLYTFSYTFSE